MALGLGAEGVSHLHRGQWQMTVGYRHLSGDRGYVGSRFDPTYASTVGARININSLDLQATYGLSDRYSLTLTAPVVVGSVSSFRDHEDDGIHRHTMSAGGLGDVRLVGNAWLLDPRRPRSGNLSLSVGFKAPTGKSSATDTAFKRTGPVVIPVDIAIQPGDGGWGIVLETLAYRKVFSRTHAYAAGFYLLNARQTNDAVTTVPVYGQIRNLSVPDQYLGRLGLSWAPGWSKGASVSLGGRIDGVPTHDRIGGSDGFRRPGMAVYVEPGLSYTRGGTAYSLFVPAAVYVNRQANTLDIQNGRHGPGAFADFLIIAGVSHRF